MLWAIASSPNIELHTRAMEALQTHDEAAYKWVKNAPNPSHWCKAFFNPNTKCDILTNNLCESFNAHILEARDKPIISLMETIREMLMERIQRRKDHMVRFPHSTGPLIRKVIDERVRESFKWRGIYNGISGYQLKGPFGAQFTVDIRKKTCSCFLWDISGLPCCHAIVAFKHQGVDVYEMVDECYKKDLFLIVYNNVLYPINGKEMWPQSTMTLPLDPPISVVQPGRPRRARRRDIDEGKDHGKRVKRFIVIHCSKCGQSGHNAKTCKVQAANINSTQQHANPVR